MSEMPKTTIISPNVPCPIPEEIVQAARAKVENSDLDPKQKALAQYILEEHESDMQSQNK